MNWGYKKSWKATLPFYAIYVSKTTGRKDISLSSLCAKEKELTLTKRGFKQFKFCDLSKEIDKDHKYLTKPLPKLKESPEDIAHLLVEQIEKYLIHLWDSNRFHLVFCSAGVDSRILSWVLAGLRDKMGKDWLGKIHFRCHEPEGKIFKSLMKTQGWDESEYSIYREGKFNGPYFDIGRFENDVNGFHRPFAEFWNDLVDEKQTVLVNGLCGSTMFSYPTGKNMGTKMFAHRFLTDNRYQDLIRNGSGLLINWCNIYDRWEDLLLPFLSYGYLDIAFRVPRKYFKWVETPCYSDSMTFKTWNKRDLMRVSMLNTFKDKLPVYIGHVYNFKVSQRRAKYMKRMFLASKFYRDFKHLSFVRNAKPAKIYLKGSPTQVIKSLDTKLYGYATMYENVGCS